MSLQKISLIPNGGRYILVMLVIASSFVIPQASQLAYAHTFSTSESADFLSLVEQIKAEATLTTMNLRAVNDNDNATALAQAHAQKASNLLLVENNDTLGEIREVNDRIANSLQSGLKNLEGNVTALASSSTTQGQTPPPQDKIQSINQTVQSLDDTLAEAVSVRIEQSERNNATTWAMTLADLVNAALSDYGNATGASFDLTDMSNMVGISNMTGDMHMHDTGSNSNMTAMASTMTMNGSQMQISNNINSGSQNNTMSMTMTSSNSSMSNATSTTATVVDRAAYQSAQYLANNTILQLFNDTLKPLTLSSNNTTSAASSNNTTTSMTEQEQSNNNTSLNATSTMSNLDKLEAGLLQLRDNINDKATPQEVMMTAHQNIHPLIMQIYGLTLEQEEGGGAE